MDSTKLNPPAVIQPNTDHERPVKKRTKTGCHTCRTRRIKCDETKPECNNCTKSRRKCEGYGMDRVGGSKKPQRHAPYGDGDDSKRVYKNIVPAPPKELSNNSASSIAAADAAIQIGNSSTSSKPRGPKRKRDEEISSHDDVDWVGLDPPAKESMVHAKRDSPMIRSLSLYRYGDASRIPISSLLTVDQATIAAYVSQQSLNTYIPNYHNSSPLQDPICFAVFRHYVEVVAPTMSLIESSPPNPSILNYYAIPDMKACNLFTYQIPVMAVSGNWAIMEAILAISFLHLSHVTRSSKQQAFLHYQLAVKRLQIDAYRVNAARDLGLLSATLLLAWYELTTGDHLKWIRHMTGAMTVLIEFGSSRWKVAPKAPAQEGNVPRESTITNPNDNAANKPFENMRAVTDYLQKSTGRVLLHELFYLYAKMDVIQALVRGAAPLLDLPEWKYPLRGPKNTIVGLHDALLHLMARLAAFIAKDRERKTTTQSQEPMFPPAPPTIPQSSNQQSTSAAPNSTWSPSSSYTSATDPQHTPGYITSHPLHEWEVLDYDFQTWKSDFNDLVKTRVEPNMPTPFGPAIIYSDIRVAAAQMLYLAAQIHLLRAHPSTPPSIARAIQIMAPQTGPKVAEIMRIQEGLWDTANFRKIRASEDGRTVGGDGTAVDHVISALSNCAWPMLVGGVQVRDEMQRKWMKTRLCDIYEISGFATAMRVRKGLEIGWGHRVRGEPTKSDDIDSDEETDLSLLAHEQREQARELRQRKKRLNGGGESRFVLVRAGETYFGDYDVQMDSTYAYGLFSEPDACK